MQFPSRGRTGTGVDFLFYLQSMKLPGILISLIIVTIFISCSSSDISKKVSSSDSVVVNFKTNGNDSITKTVSATESSAIHKLLEFADTKSAPEFKCGYDGNLVFYSKGQQLLPVVFQYKDADCRHFLFELDGKLVSTKLSKEAADFFESLEKGNNQY
jgi:hypothetical protein